VRKPRGQTSRWRLPTIRAAGCWSRSVRVDHDEGAYAESGQVFDHQRAGSTCVDDANLLAAEDGLAAVRQRRTTRPRDLPYGEERLAVRWLKVQYACLESWCPRKAFTEQIAEVPAGSRVTGRLRRATSPGAGRAGLGGQCGWRRAVVVADRAAPACPAPRWAVSNLVSSSRHIYSTTCPKMLWIYRRGADVQAAASAFQLNQSIMPGAYITTEAT